ncbi:flavin reductase family protein [Streptomyces sp. NPDC048291]|uniref:flavin reductase family protein n=1 Tax=Streptomyces sp. NPDC048291 TaxID=3365530 RepID=UPI0037163C0A
MPEHLRRVAAPAAVAPPRFRALMASFPAGVTVVTAAGRDGRPQGMTCTAVSSVSDEPATLLVCLKQGSRTLASLTEAARFAVNLLGSDARPVAELFAARGADRFARVPWAFEPGSGGPHLTRHAHTVADCRVTRTVDVGEHAVVFGEVFAVTARAGTAPDPLLYGLRGYWALGRPGDESGAAGTTIQQRARS